MEKPSLVVEVDYLDTNLGYRRSSIYHMPINFHKNQVIYLLRKSLGFGYYNRYIRDVRIFFG